MAWRLILEDLYPETGQKRAKNGGKIVGFFAQKEWHDTMHG